MAKREKPKLNLKDVFDRENFTIKRIVKGRNGMFFIEARRIKFKEHHYTYFSKWVKKPYLDSLCKQYYGCRITLMDCYVKE